MATETEDLRHSEGRGRGPDGKAAGRRSTMVAAVAVAIVVALLAATAPASANSRYAGIVIDAVSGEVFYQDNADTPLYPASLTKMMTLYMAFRALDDGRLSLGQRITMSRHAASQPPSHLGLPAGGTLTVEQAIYALVTRSANDVAAALGEAIGGTESGFAELMTAEARRLGMSSTTFRNASGLPNRQQRSTARDMARLAQALIHEFPVYYQYFATQRWTFRGTTYRNHNRLLGQYDGMDGLKTGYIRASGYNLAASAVRGRLRVIAVVFGGRTSASRNAHVADLLDRAFESERGRHLIAHGSVPNVPLPARHPRDRNRPLMVGDPVTLIPTAAGGAIVRAGAPFVPPIPTRRPGSEPVVVAMGSADLADEELTALINSLSGPSPTASGAADWGIQIGAFSDAADGVAAINDVVAAMPDVLGSARGQIIEVPTGATPLYRARLMGLDYRSASTACWHLMASGEACMPIAP